MGGVVGDFFSSSSQKNILDPGGFVFDPDQPDIPQAPPIPTFKGLTTPGFSLQPGEGGSFDLTRTTDTAARFGALTSSLQGNQGNFLGLIERLKGLGVDTAGLQSRAGGLLGESAGLRGQLAGTLPGLGALGQAAGGIGARFGALEGELAGVQAGIQPGFGRLTDAQIAASRNRESAAAGNLRDTLAQRNLAGSSLGIQEGRRQKLDFGQQEAEIRGQAFQQELAATRDIAGVRGQILAGELGSVEEQRQIIADTRTTINQIGGLLQLDQSILAQQAGLIGLQLGLTEAQSNVFSNELANIQVQMQAFQQQIGNELNELGIAGNIINQVQAMAAQVGIAQAKLTAEAAAGLGYAQAAERGQTLGLLGSVGGTVLGGFFGGPAGAAAGNQVGGALGQQVGSQGNTAQVGF